MGKKLKKKNVADAKKVEFYKITNPFGNIEKLVFPNVMQVGLNSDLFNSTISGSIHLTRQGLSYLVAGTNVTITSASNGQVTIDASANAGSDGDDGSPGQNAKSVNLTASSTIIQYDAAGSNPSPASITLTATSQEFTDGFFKFTGGGGSFSDEGSYTDGSAANSDTATFTSPSSFSSTPYDFRVGVAEAGQSELVFDTLSIGSTRIGTTGNTGNTGDTGATGPSTPDAAFTRSVIPVDTDDTGGALDDGNDLADADISQQAFTKIDVNVGATNVTFAGHNSSGDPSNNNYKIVSANVTAVTDNGTSLTVTNNAGSEGDTSYNITCANASATRLKLAVSSDSSDAKLRVSFLAEHEDGSNTDFNSVLVSVPIKITTAAGTQTITRSFTVQKIKKGTAGTNGSNGSDGSDGSDGAVALAIFGVDSSSSSTESDNAVSQTASSTAQFTTPYRNTAVVANTNVVSSASSGELTLNGNGTYSVTVAMDVQQAGHASNVYELTLALDDGAGSFTTLSYLSSITPGGDNKTGNLSINNAIVTASSGGVIKLKSQIKKSVGNDTFLHVNQSNQRLATIRVEKLS